MGGSDKTGNSPFFIGIATAVAAAVGALHVAENYTYIRHLGRIPDRGLAQAAALQTENAFYYSYYAELVRADGILDGLEQIIWDRRSEYPDVLNAIRRFNIYQEVVLAFCYRLLRFCALDVIDAWDFFRYNILLLNGVGHAALALLSSELSGNPFAGVACFLAGFLNRFQISRLGNYSSSNLRELWGIPVLWVQTLCLWHLLLNSGRRRRFLECAFGATSFVFIVFWQFSPFLLLLQATALYFVYLVCGYHELRPLVARVVNIYLLALGLAIAVHFGSPYLLTSPFLFQLVALKLSTSVRCCDRCGRRLRPCLSWVCRRAADVGEGLIALVAFVAIRKAMAPLATADTHVYEILCTKVSAVNGLLPTQLQLPQSRLPDCAEPSFNARLYLIMGVFNLLERQSLQIYRDSLASPAAALTCALVALRCLLSCCPSCGPARLPEKRAVTDTRPAPRPAEGLRKRKGAKGEVKGSGEVKRPPGKPEDEQEARVAPGSQGRAEEAAMLVFVVQFLLFFLLGGLINRLRVAFGPPMMVLAASCFGARLLPVCWQRQPVLLGGLALLFCAQVLWMVWQLPCISSSDGVCQNYSDKSSSDGDLADLCDWINSALGPSTPVLSSMNVAGSLRLFTAVPLIIHPQFESENLRKRVQMAYELYHCGSEESFARTMRALQAEVVIFEYARCFFTPYLLDDRRKNCNSKKHAPEDQLCVKLHAQPRLFERIFTNGGYAVFRLSDSPRPKKDTAPMASPVGNLIASPEAWQDYVDACAKTQPGLCGPRLLETAATWEHTMKRKKVAGVLRRLAEKRFPEDGYVAYYLGRYLDYDASQPEKALEYYNRALRKLPNNPIIMKEWIMLMDMAIKDTNTLAKLLQSRKEDKGDGRVPLLQMDGPGVGVLLCEASVSAKSSPGLQAFGDQLWAKALHLAPLSECIKNNWQLIYGESNKYEETHTDWDKVRMLIAGGVQHDVGSHNQPAVRFLGDRLFNLAPCHNSTGSSEGCWSGIRKQQ